MAKSKKKKSRFIIYLIIFFLIYTFLLLLVMYAGYKKKLETVKEEQNEIQDKLRIDNNLKLYASTTYIYLMKTYNNDDFVLKDSFHRYEDDSFYETLRDIAYEAGYRNYRDEFVKNSVGYDEYYSYTYIRNSDQASIHLIVSEFGEIFEEK